MTKQEAAMLVLNTKKHDYILIGKNIRVHVEDYVTDSSMSISFEAPSDVTIWRGGLYRAGAGKWSPHPCESTESLTNLRITFRKGDYVMIGDDIKVQFQGNRKGNASIGIAAPREMKVLRRSLFEGQNAPVISQDERAARQKRAETQIAKAKQRVGDALARPV